MHPLTEVLSDVVLHVILKPVKEGSITAWLASETMVTVVQQTRLNSTPLSEDDVEVGQTGLDSTISAGAKLQAGAYRESVRSSYHKGWVR